MTLPKTKDVESALDRVFDPCSEATGLPAGLVTMGMIKSIKVEGTDKQPLKISVGLRLTSPHCMMVNVLEERIIKELKTDFDGCAVHVWVEDFQSWTPDLMSKDYQARRQEQLDKLRLNMKK